MEELVHTDPESEHLLAAISGVERSFRAMGLSEKIGEKLTLKEVKS